MVLIRQSIEEEEAVEKSGYTLTRYKKDQQKQQGKAEQNASKKKTIDIHPPMDPTFVCGRIGDTMHANQHSKSFLCFQRRSNAPSGNTKQNKSEINPDEDEKTVKLPSVDPTDQLPEPKGPGRRVKLETGSTSLRIAQSLRPEHSIQYKEKEIKER